MQVEQGRPLHLFRDVKGENRRDQDPMLLRGLVLKIQGIGDVRGLCGVRGVTVMY